MRILLDTNIILDIALKRDTFYNNSVKVFKLIDNRNLFAFISATTITDIYYIAKKQTGHEKSIEFIRGLLKFAEPLSVDKEIIIGALESKINDFEDAVQSSVAIENDLDFNVSRNVKDYLGSTVKTVTPEEFISLQKDNL